jgi:hypothetical protein
MDDRGNANGSGWWSRRRFLLQTGKFSAFALIGPPLAEPPASSTLPDPKSNHFLMLGHELKSVLLAAILSGLYIMVSFDITRQRWQVPER